MSANKDNDNIENSKDNNIDSIKSPISFPEELINFLIEAPIITNHLFSKKSPMTRIKINGEIIETPRRGAIKKFHISPTDFITCILWDGECYITGNDIIRLIKLFLDDKNIIEEKKLIENIWSALRNIKNTRLELSKSELLRWLDLQGCIRTIKTQKLFAWASVDYSVLIDIVKGKNAKSKKNSNQSSFEKIKEESEMLSSLSNQKWQESKRNGNEMNEEQVDLENTLLPPSNFYYHSNDSYLFWGNSNFLPATISPSLTFTEEFSSFPSSFSSSCSSLSSSYSAAINNSSIETCSIGHSTIDKMEISCQETDDCIDSSLNDRKFQCKYAKCRKIFKRMEHLRRHQRSHTGERPFICKKCQKSFARSDNLAQHFRIHLDSDEHEKFEREREEEKEKNLFQCKWNVTL